MSNQIIIRIDDDLKSKVTKLAYSEGKTTSQVVRELIESYVKERDIKAYVDDLWDRVGSKFRAKGLAVEDVERTISEVRAGK